ncbi:MAG TPA: SpoIID/LytB domain-containing protein [Vicinamibacterales bacterium]|nr:SpoIID/LytB domain-containing protein [Vicinamibacterales bacterium]
MRSLHLALLLLVVQLPQPAGEPIVRIGLTQNAATVTVQSAEPFTVAERATKTATFSSVVAVDPNATGAIAAADLQYRVTVRLDDGSTQVLPAGARVRISPTSSPLQIETRAYRGALEIFGNSRRTLTVVNELPMETYLLGVVPNELNPAAFGQLEALKAQAVAARTYIQRNMGQYKKEGYDICATDACQVYFGVLTEDPLATQAVMETRGVIATHEGRPIQALYSSTCGGRTEDAEHIFTEKLPYLVSVSCEYTHPAMPFTTSRVIRSWKDGVLAVAGVKSFRDAARFMGLEAGREPTPAANAVTLATFIRRTFYPSVLGKSDLSFVQEQGILTAGEVVPRRELLFRLIDKKSAFEWQQGVLVSFDPKTRVMRLTVGGQLKEFVLDKDALIYHRVGESRQPLRKGSWIGGELVEFRSAGGVIPMLVYRLNFANPAADRYSRVAIWQVRKTKAELDAAFRSQAIGEFVDMRVIDRGESERLISTEIIGTTGRATVPALRLRTLLALRDSLFSYDIERNADGAVVGATFFGRGWGHGVGMCQVGAYGMALAGATYEEILKKYYTGIDLQKLY